VAVNYPSAVPLIQAGAVHPGDRVDIIVKAPGTLGRAIAYSRTEHAQKVVFIPASLESLSFDPYLGGLLLPEQVEGQAP